MMVVPRRNDVRIYYEARAASDVVGLLLTAGAAVYGALCVVRRSRRRAGGPAPGTEAVLSRMAAAMSSRAGGLGAGMLDACDLPAPPRRWGGIIPTAVLAFLALGRFVPGAAPVDAGALHEKAERAYAEGRFADAAEYARHALRPSRGSGLHGQVLALRGESLMRAGRAREAAEAFEALATETPEGPYTAEALFGAAQAYEAAGDPATAARHRERLLAEFGDTAWAARAREAGGR
jgi:tetratricopeptide (TPR) repeat protein